MADLSTLNVQDFNKPITLSAESGVSTYSLQLDFCNGIKLSLLSLFDEPELAGENSSDNIVGIFSNNFGSLDFSQIVVKTSTNINGTGEIELKQL